MALQNLTKKVDGVELKWYEDKSRMGPC